MAHYIQDYTKGKNNYDLMQSMLQGSMKPIQGANAATSLGKVLTAYFASKGMSGANKAMDAAVTGRDDQSETDMAQAMSAYRGDTMPRPGVTDRGTGQNVGAMAQALMGSHDPATQKLGMGALLRETKQNTTLYRNLEASGLIPGSPEFQKAMRENVNKSGVTINMGTKQTKGRTKLDETFAQEYSALVASGGFADITKQIGQLKSVSAKLAESDSLTGPWIGAVPNWLQAFVNPKAVAAKEDVEEVVQRNLRLILGAQFTEKEGERLIARAYNPRLGEAENKKRVDRLIKQMIEAAEAKVVAAKYFGANGTLTGFQGKLWTAADFDVDKDTSKVVTTIAHPQTDADFEALKPGDYYIDPDDGMKYQKN